MNQLKRNHENLNKLENMLDFQPVYLVNIHYVTVKVNRFGGNYFVSHEGETGYTPCPYNVIEAINVIE